MQLRVVALESQWTTAGKEMEREKQIRHPVAVFIFRRGTSSWREITSALAHPESQGNGGTMRYLEGGHRKTERIRFRDMAGYASELSFSLHLLRTQSEGAGCKEPKRGNGKLC